MPCHKEAEGRWSRQVGLEGFAVLMGFSDIGPTSEGLPGFLRVLGRLVMVGSEFHRVTSFQATC